MLKERIPFSPLNKLGWIYDFQREIALWQQWILIGQETRNEIRQRGFTEGAEDRLADRLLSMQMAKTSENFACTLIDYVAFESSKLLSGEKSLGSTEVIESLFGYDKSTKAGLWDSYCGIGQLILTMASRVGELSREFVKTALEKVRTRDVVNWLENSLVYV